MSMRELKTSFFKSVNALLYEIITIKHFPSENVCKWRENNNKGYLSWIHFYSTFDQLSVQLICALYTCV